MTQENITNGRSVIPFSYEDTEIRVIMDSNDTPWWVAADVCGILGLSNPTEALRSLDEDEKNTLRLSEGIPGNPTVNVINESGLYALIIRSNKPEARPFRKWITSEVLPTIRKTGSYSVPGKADLAEQTWMFETLSALTDLPSRMEKIEAAQTDLNRYYKALVSAYHANPPIRYKPWFGILDFGRDRFVTKEDLYKNYLGYMQYVAEPDEPVLSVISVCKALYDSGYAVRPGFTKGHGGRKIPVVHGVTIKRRLG